MAPRKRSKRPASIKGLSVSPPSNITAQNLAAIEGPFGTGAGKLEVLAERIAVRRFIIRIAELRGVVTRSLREVMIDLSD
jgi:hypothetical protein